MAKIIDGKIIAQGIKDEVREKAAKLFEATGVRPKLSVILVGDDPGSQVYVRNKEKACAEAGIETETHRLPASYDEKQLIELIKGLNAEQKVHGILVQLPLPKCFNEKEVLINVAPAKDVDGLHIENLGRLFAGQEPYFYPCTPSGIIRLILSTGAQIKGKEAVVVGRSNIVGKPTAMLLLGQHATVTICHSRTMNLGEIVKRADILVAAIGKAGTIKADMIKRGAIVIDVGMNRLPTGLAGDVDFEGAREVAGYITPVPGGVGPMTIAMLLSNTLTSAERFAGYR
ncbi:bifunctional methylenetetrahydrofolate dehydrogenase/methenyltetrahydrofolate cyclohydrolase FolD [Candidatus Saganbacteria bacterium]|nr:bifunctional methylenetetrahydrofolate dehydrogenase/methenyltetrahydrofolate cyclohydrolase FolD [Candidatus Saganbacteria bacterium]